MSPRTLTAEALGELRRFNYERIYTRPESLAQSHTVVRVLTDLVGASQSAVGALQAAQATNQLLALQSRQLIQTQQLQAAQGRATALEQARGVAAEERAREQRRRFMTGDANYTVEALHLFEE